MEMATGLVPEATTQALASLKVATLGVGIAGVFAALFANRFPIIVLLPALVINCFFLQITVAHGLLFSLVHFPWMYLWSLPLRLLFGLPPVASYLFTYTPILVILIRRKHDRHNIIGRFFIRAIWDPPLMACIYLVAHTGLDGGRFMTPFLTYIDDAIVVGSLPLPKDVKVMVEDHKIGAVINMTEEYEGPLGHYESHGVRQLRLPTVDTTSPSLESVMLGVSFIRDFMDDNPDKRIFIHCKGGRGRAAVMAACWYMFKERRTPRETVSMLKSKRHVVSSAVSTYETVIRYHQLVTADTGKGGKGGKEDTEDEGSS